MDSSTNITQNFLSSSAIKKEFYDKLKSDKIKINWNKNPIDMELFLSFLTVKVKRSTDHLGSCTGWTLLENDELKLKIGGGIINNKELLDTLQFGTNLSNSYNNYVNPFYLFEILNKEGQQFFVKYYKDDIQKILEKQKDSVSNLETSLMNEKEILNKMVSEFKKLSKK